LLADGAGRAGITTVSIGAIAVWARRVGITSVTETTVAVALLELDWVLPPDSGRPTFALPNVTIKLNENTAALDGCFTTITPLVGR